jgi:hypothetical protein
MSRHASHPHADEPYGRPVAPDASAQLRGTMFDPEPAPAPASPDIQPPTLSVERRAKAERIRDARWARWIDAGRPVALLVAAQDGKVTAETFRLAAEQLPHVLPPTYGEDRTLSYLSAMFAELVADGYLQKRRRADGSVVKVYSGEQRNEHVVYELADASARRSA